MFDKSIPRLGFTLVEMLVVIGIISILASLLMPSLQNAMASARSIKCINNQKSVGLTYIQYDHEYNGFIPPYWAVHVGGTGNYHACSLWYNFLGKYAGYDWDIYHNVENCQQEPMRDAFMNSVFYCPEYPREEIDNFHMSYGVSLYIPPANGWGNRFHFGRLSMVSRPSSKILLSSGNGVHLGNASEVTFLCHAWNVFRHGSGTNTLFLDWHSSFRSANEIVEKITSDFSLSR